MTLPSEQDQAIAAPRLRWGWILAGGFLVEIGIFAVFIPALLLFGETVSQYVAVAASLVAAFVCAYWIARRVGSRFVLHGFLVGAVALLLYVGISFGQPQPGIYILGHLLKLVGGIGGGSVAGKRR